MAKSYIAESPSLAVAVRPLGVFEQLLWVLEQHSPTHFVVGAQIAGPTTVQQWRTAVDALQTRHPNASLYIDLDEKEIPNFYRNASAQIPLRVLPGHETNWEREMEKELATPFNAKEAPLLRAVLLHQPERAVLLLSAHHSIADGLSLVFAIRDIVRVLSGAVLDPLPPLPAYESLIDLPIAPSSQTDTAAPAPELGPPGVLREASSAKPRIHHINFAQSLTSRLQERVREEKTTVHGALMAATALAARQRSTFLGDRSTRILSPVNARTALDPMMEDITLCTSGAIAALQPSSIQQFWDLARQGRTGVAPAQTLEAIAGMISLLKQSFGEKVTLEAALQLMTDGFASDVVISNLGNISFGQFGHLKIERIWGPAVLVGLENEQVIGVATVNGSLSLLHSSYTPLPAFLETIHEIIRSACG